MLDQDEYALGGYCQNWPPGSEEEVDKAFRNAAKELHPDQGGSEEQFKEIKWEKDLLTEKVNEPEEEVTIDDIIEVESIFESVCREQNFAGNYNLRHPASDVMYGREKWSGIIEEEESSLSIHLDIFLPFETDEIIEFDVRYVDGTEEIRSGEGQTEPISDYMASNMIDNKFSAYTGLVADVCYHVIQESEEILYSN